MHKSYWDILPNEIQEYIMKLIPVVLLIDIKNKLNEQIIKRDKLSDESDHSASSLKLISQTLPSAKRLTMLYMKKCDFCNNECNTDTLQHCITIHSGFQICDTCYNNKKHKTATLYYLITYNYIYWNFIFKYLPNFPDTNNNLSLTIIRSNGKKEDNWKPNHECLIEIKGDILMPLINYDYTITKGVPLKELCKYNEMFDYDDVMRIINIIVK